MSTLTFPTVTCRPAARRRPQARVRAARVGPVHGRLRLTRRGRVAVLALLLALAFAGAVLLRSPAAATSEPVVGAPVAERVTVRPGETLWVIAQRAVPGADPRVTVDRIMEMNGLESSAVQAGSALLVPTGS